jgi:tRNA threonylcarbamoyladenosine biosynthesis protein TsaB
MNENARKPLILAVETSGRMGSAAVAVGEQVLAEKTFSGPMRHNAELFPAVCSLIDGIGRRASEIEHIYISVGPGSFTGLRIAVTMAKIMNLAGGVKIAAVDTLDVIAANASDYIEQEKTDIERVAAVLDAKRGQFFIAAYQRRQGRWEKILPDSLMSVSQFFQWSAGSDKPLWLLGEGLVYYREKFKAEGIDFLPEQYWVPTAGKVHFLGWQKAMAGEFADAAKLVPNYLRLPDVGGKIT